MSARFLFFNRSFVGFVGFVPAVSAPILSFGGCPLNCVHVSFSFCVCCSSFHRSLICIFLSRGIQYGAAREGGTWAAMLSSCIRKQLDIFSWTATQFILSPTNAVGSLLFGVEPHLHVAVSHRFPNLLLMTDPVQNRSGATLSMEKNLFFFNIFSFSSPRHRRQARRQCENLWGRLLCRLLLQLIKTFLKFSTHGEVLRARCGTSSTHSC